MLICFQIVGLLTLQQVMFGFLNFDNFHFRAISIEVAVRNAIVLTCLMFLYVIAL